ncbi:baculoviral IAP repeat-containing protein 3-like [Elysia marginata]|uniref:Baculoviral IAP repeat-containing protein 3-like n=1 Tax=Elysia marginata TaxID=1093978 RepID=A0AAV4GYF8_9GAST|nr:baculoviral IAP repeat-containing protein 3-like [Elysia marginata]
MSYNNGPLPLQTHNPSVFEMFSTSHGLETGVDSHHRYVVPSTFKKSSDLALVVNSFTSANDALPTRGERRVLFHIIGFPVHLHFATMQAREASFISAQWPQHHPFRPQKLAFEGFFYGGFSDCARCFYCGIGLKNWCSEYSIAQYHEFFSPRCAYRLLLHGASQTSSGRTSKEIKACPHKYSSFCKCSRKDQSSPPPS